MNLSEGYGVLKCHVIAGRKELDDNTPHYQVHVNDGKFDYRLAINVRSSIQPHDLLYFIDDDFQYYITDELEKLDLGWEEIKVPERKPGGICFDYIRGNLFKVEQMKPLPYNVPGENNDLNELIDGYIQRAIETKATIYVFGEPWGIDKVEKKPDKIFGFQPGRGIHNIHMNQGSSGRFGKENGVYQDGALLIHYPSAPGSQDHWVAAFFAFQSQSFHTDDRTGDPIDKRVGNEPQEPGVPKIKVPMRIIAALVNPPGDDRTKESVTLINSSPKAIDLTGWSLADKLKHKQSLDGLVVEAGAAVKVDLSGETIQLSNKGGIISLLDAEGTKVDGVDYTKKDATEEGWTLVFGNG